MNYEDLLQTYSFEDLLELNDLTEAEVLEYLVSTGFLQLPDPCPL